MEVRHLLIDIDVLWLIVENKAFFSRVFQEQAFLHPALFSHGLCCVVLAYTKNQLLPV